MTDRLAKVISQVFDVPEDLLTDQENHETIESWDSMAHLNLILALEAEFNVSISADDAAEMLSVGLIRKILSERGVLEVG